jgi:hypothetical protein
VQFGEKYFKNLTLVEDTDDFGRPADTWKNKQTKIGTYPEAAKLTYTAKVKVGDIYSDLGLTKNVTVAGTALDYYSYDDIADDYVIYKVDGAVQVDFDGAGDVTISKGDSNKIGGNGALTEVFYNSDDNKVIITTIKAYFGEVTGVTDATSSKDRFITVDEKNYNVVTGGNFTTDDFAAEDKVVYNYSYKTGDDGYAIGVKNVAVAEKATGELTAYTAKTSVTVAGETKKESATVNFNESTHLNKNVDIYLDSYGYVIFMDGASTDDTYAYVLKAGTGTYGTDYKAQLLLSDGTVVDADVAASATPGTLHTYTVSSSGKYTLSANLGTSKTTLASGANLTVTRGTGIVTLSDTGSVTTNANGETIFLVVTGTTDDPVYNSYTGIAAVPSVTMTGTGAVGSNADYAYYDKDGDGVAEIIFVDARSAAVTGGTNDVVFILKKSSVKTTKDSRGTYYTFDAVVDGQITTIDVDVAKVDDGTYALKSGSMVFSNVTLDNNNIMTSGTTPAGTVYGNGVAIIGTKQTKNGVVTLGGTSYGCTDDCVVFFISEDDDISKSSVNSIGTDVTDQVYFVKNSDGKVEAIFIQKVAG